MRISGDSERNSAALAFWPSPGMEQLRGDRSPQEGGDDVNQAHVHPSSGTHLTLKIHLVITASSVGNTEVYFKKILKP
jgi:hypothetical protein